MRRTSVLALGLAFGCLVLGAGNAALAQCTLPYALTNGQPADATQVMANFNAIANCINNPGPGGSTNALQYNAGSGTYGGVGPLTDGQLAIGSTGSAPQAQNLTAGAGISITNGSGQITIARTDSGLYRQVLSATPTAIGTGLSQWLNQGSASVSDSAVGISINAPVAGASGNVTGRYMAAPSTPYTVRVLIAATRSSTTYSGVGIGWYDGSSKLHLISYVTNNGGASKFEVEKWNGVTSFNANDFVSALNAFSQPVWLQIQDDGTNVSFAFSQDGANFLQLFSVAKSSGFLGASGYSNVGFFINPQGGRTLGTLMSWTQN